MLYVIPRPLLASLLLLLATAVTSCGKPERSASPGDDGGGEGEGEGPAEGEGEGPAEGEGEGEDPGPPPEHPISPWEPAGLSGRAIVGLSIQRSEPRVVWAATRRHGLHRMVLDDDPAFEAVPAPDEDLCDVTQAREDLWVVLEGEGVFASNDDGSSWREVNAGYEVPDLPMEVAAKRPIGRHFVVDGDDLYLVANAGGLFRLREDGEGWDNLTVGAGVINPTLDAVFVDDDGTLYLGCSSLSSFVPPVLAAALEAVLYRSTDGGAGWERYDTGIDAHHVTGFARADDQLLASTYGGGVYRLDEANDEWVTLGDLPDPDVLGVWTVPGGGALISGANGYLMASEGGGRWIREVTGALHAFSPVISADFLTGKGGRDFVGLAGDGVYEIEGVLGGPRADRGEPPRVEDGEVHVALSFHVNLYHSYRGDTADEDGFGMDIRVIRSILEMLERHPQVRADWDFDNAFSFDDLLPRHAPDILDKIQARLAKPEEARDSVRIMSWNNGMMGAETEEEVRHSILMAQDSYKLRFGTEVAPGLQPQENMFSPDLVEVLLEEDLGIEWVSLFYSATNFTAFRRDTILTTEQAYNVLSLLSESGQGEEGGRTLKLIPVYHHADVVDHGGLTAWVRQIHRAMPNQDALLGIHFDADAESWLGFEKEIQELEDAGLPFLRWNTLQGYFYRHSARPKGEVVLARDLADGSHDGYASWAEKWINREVWTPIERARMKADGAFSLLHHVHAQERGTVVQRLQTARVERLKALSTTHFGLANPSLHPDREAAALAQSAAAEDKALDALVDATARVEPAERPAGTAWLFHPGEDPFTGLARIPVEFPRGSYDVDTLTVRLHRVGDADDRGVRVPSELVSWQEHPDGTVASGEVWASVELAGRELAGVSFESPGLPPSFGDDIQVSRRRLSNGLVEVQFSGDGLPFNVMIEHDRREVVPIGGEDWWQPWITWQGQRYAPDSYDVEVTNSGDRGFLGEVVLTSHVDVPQGGRWHLQYTFRVVRDQRLLFVEVETTYPGEGADDRLTEAVPVGLYPWLPVREMVDCDDDPETPQLCPTRPWVERHVVWRDTYRGTFGGFPVQELRDTINSAAAMGWVGVFTTLVATDRWVRSSPAFVPMRFLRGQGQDVRVLLAPFGTLDGDQPDPMPERTSGTGLGARLTRLASHMGPVAPSLAGRTERFSLGLAGIPAVLGGHVSAKPGDVTREAARAFATRPLIIRP